MNQDLKARLKIGGVIATAIMCITASVPLVSMNWISMVRAERQRVDDQIGSLRRVESLLVDAETGQRGFIITGDDSFLQPYRVATAELPKALLQLKQRYAEEPRDEQQVVGAIVDNAQKKLAELADTIALRRAAGAAAVEAIVAGGEGKRFMDEVRLGVDDVAEREARELTELDQELSHKTVVGFLFAALSTVVTLGLLAYLARLVWRSALARQRAMHDVAQASETLRANFAELEKRNRDISVLGEMSQVLQTEMTLVESLEVTGMFCRQLLPDTSGGVYLFRNSLDLLEQAAIWGDHAPSMPQTMSPQSCWGLRRGFMHVCASDTQLACRHYEERDTDEGFELCLPLIAYGEVLGLLHVTSDQPTSAQRITGAATMAKSVAEQVSLSLSNAKLRQVLRDQSIKDPLTGLFNRRFMEENMKRELARARRNGTQLAVIVADLDHFKKINDTHGHSVGDAVLKGAALHFQGGMRESDIACRFGGEEFVMILPDCSKEGALSKANKVRAELAELAFRAEGTVVHATASFGVAAYPLDGHDSQSLVAAADTALYKAKHGGRNRVVAAGQAHVVPATEPAAALV